LALCARDGAPFADDEGILRSLVACAGGESSPKNGALRVLLLPIGVHAVFIRIAVDADRSIGMRRMPTTESVNIMLLFQ
jgi:hypothetical protein